MGARKIFKEFVITTIEKARDIFGYRKKLEEGKEKKQKQDEDNEFIETVVKEQEKKEVLEKRKIYNLSSKEIYERQRQNQTKKQKDTLDRYYTEKEGMERVGIRRLERIRANQGRSHKSNYNSRRYTSSTNSKNSIKQTKSTYTQGVAKKQTKNNTNLKNKRKIKQQSLKNKNTSKIIIKEERPISKKSDKIIQYDERPISKKSDKIIQYDERYKKDFQRMQKAYDKSSIYKVLDGGITEKKGKNSTKKAENEFKNRYSFVVKSTSSEPDKKTSKEEKNINRNIRPEEQKGTEHDLKNFFDL